jgi:outer membrane cobalamin receptor
MRKIVLITLLGIISATAGAQTATIKGLVRDAGTKELLPAVNVVELPANGTSTNLKGEYTLSIKAGGTTVVISSVGYKTDTLTFNLKEGETKVYNATITTSEIELTTYVVGATKSETKIQKQPITVEVLKARLLTSNNITNLQGALAKVPGVSILDGQVAIRGGSGYAYGTGSRVMLIVDELPMMSPDRGEIEWSMFPIENVDQVEVIKGATSLQYGSSALNGVIRTGTGWAKDTAETRITMYYTGIGAPPVDSFQWWKRDGQFFNNPNTMGANFVHKQKFSNGMDLVVNGFLQASRSHLNEEYDDIARVNAKFRYIPVKLQRLQIGFSIATMNRRNGSQFYWKDAGSPYEAASGVSIDENYWHIMFDPYIKYVDKGNNSHRLLTRIYRKVDGGSPEDGPKFTFYTVDYQFRHDFGSLAKLMVGVSNTHAKMVDGTLGKHKYDNPAGYVLAEFNYKFFSANTGARFEAIRLDSQLLFSQPLFGAGMNFQVRKYNYIRASVGQSFRVPTVAERYVVYDLAGIQIKPNPNIQPESGITFELGYKRSIKVGNWLGYVDLVTFWTEFKNMVEFQFGIDKIDGKLVPYFQSQNVARARIFGYETTLAGEGKIGPADISLLAGYTYFYGVDLNEDTTLNKNIGKFLKQSFQYYYRPTKEEQLFGMLKYRNRHMFKFDADVLLYQRFRFGTAIQFYSYMEKVDAVFEIFIKGLKEQRTATFQQPSVLWDLRGGVEITPNIGLNFIVKNVLNSRFEARPAKPYSPRSFTVQLMINLGSKGGFNRMERNRTNY